MSSFATPIRVDRPVAAVQVRDGLLYTERHVHAWYVLGDTDWLFQSVGQREGTLDKIAAGWAGLAGHEVHLRVTSSPVNATIWAQALDEATPDPLPDVEDSGRSWVRRLTDDQEIVTDYEIRIVMLGVRLGRAKPADELSFDLRETYDTITETVAGQDSVGFRGRVATTSEILWLMERSVSLGSPSPAARDWVTLLEQSDLAAVNEPVRWSGTSLARTTKVTVTRDEPVENHVAVLTMGRMEPQQFPENGRAPWIQFAEGLPFDVEVSLSGRVVAGPEGTGTATRWLQRATGIKHHYERDHGETPPPAVGRTIGDAERIYDEVSEGSEVDAARLECVVRYAVTAPTDEEAISRGNVLTQRYGKHMHMWPVHARGQADQLREFIPGERWDHTGHLRRLPLRLAAAAVPNVSEHVGTPVGPILGETCGCKDPRHTHRVVLHDGHYPMMKLNQSGFMVIVADLGAGKSVLEGSQAYERASRGITTSVFDPSPQGPLARLCDLPELAPFARHIPLSGANAGLLNPYRLVPEPARIAFSNEHEWSEACDAARGDRQELVLDALLGLLPYSTRRRDTVEENLRLAVVRAPSGTDGNPWVVLDQLKTLDAGLAEILEAAAVSSARFVFPDRVSCPALIKASDVPSRPSILTVITTGNLQPPKPGSDPAGWSSSERNALVKLNLAAHLTTTFAYSGDPAAPKSIFADEIRFLSYWPSGVTLIQKLVHDFRKYNGEAVAAAQHPAHLAALNIGAVLGGMWIGRQSNDAVASEVLAMGGIEPDSGYEAVVKSLHTGQFVYVDCYRRINRIKVIVRDRRLLDALDTTPGTRMLENV